MVFVLVKDSIKKILFLLQYTAHEPKMKRIIHQTVIFISIALSIVRNITSYSIGDVDPRVSSVYGMVCMLYCDVRCIYDMLIHQLLVIKLQALSGVWRLTSLDNDGEYHVCSEYIFWSVTQQLIYLILFKYHCRFTI